MVYCFLMPVLRSSDPGWWDQADERGDPIAWVVDYNAEALRVRVRHDLKAGGSWVAVGTFEDCLSGRPRLTSLRVFPDLAEAPPREGITQVVSTACIRSLHEQVGFVLSEGATAELGLKAVDDYSVAKRVGRRGRGDLYYAQIARTYVGALESPRPVEDVARKWNLSVGQAQERLRAARNRGLLTKPGKGPARGELTGKALRLLRGQ